MKAFIINLNSATERRRLMKAQLDKLGINYEFLPAIDSSSIIYRESPGIDWDYIDANRHWIPDGLIACSLSHVSVYRKIIEENLPLALILEDDTRLFPELPDIITKVNSLNISTSASIFLFYYGTREETTLTRTEHKLDDRFSILESKNPEYIITANAYLVTREACQKLVEFQSSLSATSDSWGSFINNNVIDHLYCVYPQLAEPFDLKSTINYTSGFNRYVKHMLEFIDKNRIFPFYQILRGRRRNNRRRRLKFKIE